ncbi:MAG: Flp pilus assembly protein CpaB [Firmicutes bacterium]|nr:Flp pilus assembly protein CpaB [Bacillota bacterium]
MNKFNKKILLVAIILSVITAYLSLSYIKGIKNANKKEEYINIVVAKQDILPRYKITAEMLEEIKVLKESHIVNSIQDESKIIGKYSKGKILKGEVIPKDRLIEEKDKDLSLRIPKGKRAISVAIDEISGVADLIKPGDFVDVYVTVDKKDFKSGGIKMAYPPITKLLLQDKLVLSVSKDMIRKEEERKEVPMKYPVTLAVTPLEGEKLVHGEDIGRLKLALRPIREKGTHKTFGTIRENIVPPKGKYIK